MRSTFLVPAVLAAAVTAALAASSAWGEEPAERTIQATFGNTVMSIYPDGRFQKIWIHPDGTWTGKSRRGIDLAGKWSARGEKVCLRQTRPPTLPISFCQTMPADPQVTLTSRDLTGQTIHLKIVKGVNDGAN
ncbi:MAG: hypothetical protein ACJ798_15805 [Phenylobacterium sp.]